MSYQTESKSTKKSSKKIKKAPKKEAASKTKSKAGGTPSHLTENDLLKLELFDIKEQCQNKVIDIEKLKETEFHYKERLLQQNIRITNYEKLLQKQAVTSAEVRINEIKKAKQVLLKELADKYNLGIKWSYDEFSGEIFREEKG